MRTIIKSITHLAGELRAPTFTEFARRALKFQKPLRIVETGCYRGIEGDGLSTLIMATLAKDTGGIAYSIDLSDHHLNLAKALVKDRNLDSHIKFMFGDSKEILKLPELDCIDVLYLDSYDYDPANPTPCQEHQLAEAQAILPKMNPKSIILLDDCKFTDGGKAGLSAPFIIQSGWNEVATQYQRLFVKD